jgi:hypothetical protein
MPLFGIAKRLVLCGARSRAALPPWGLDVPGSKENPKPTGGRAARLCAGADRARPYFRNATPIFPLILHTPRFR